LKLERFGQRSPTAQAVTLAETERRATEVAGDAVLSTETKKAASVDDEIRRERQN
jgi:hypothetical protein